MKIYAYGCGDGTIAGIVAAPGGKLGAGLVPGAGMEVCEIADHGLEHLDFDRLGVMLENSTVTFTAATGRLKPHNKSAKQKRGGGR